MRWHIIFGKSLESLGNYETKERAENKVESKLKHKRNKDDYKIVGIPDIRAGLILYKNKEYYKTIIDEKKSIWLMKNTENDEIDYADPTLKESVLAWIIDGKIDGGSEEYDEEYTSNVYIVPVDEEPVDYEALEKELLEEENSENESEEN